ncbi:MAG: SDR family NAD(P)-dependent oxidoreductase, partial [Aeoliella sp.]
MQPKGYAIVTGGGSGIGRAICLLLARRGWSIAVVDNRGEAASMVAEEASHLGGKATAQVFDVSAAKSWEQFARSLQRDTPRLDLLVNCAGNLLTGALDQCTADDLRRIVEVNLLGTMYGCQAMLPWMQSSAGTARPRGVINMASIFAAVAPPRFAAYNASKAGVVSFTETLRGELAPLRLNATVVLPGVTPTQLFDRAM